MSRFSRATLGAAAASLMIAAGLAAPPTAANAAPAALAGQHTPTCAVTASPHSFTESGLSPSASVAFIITVGCVPTFSEQAVEIHTPQLFNACQGQLMWYSATTTTASGNGDTFDVRLDDDGNATAIVLGSPSCAAGRDLIEADLTVAPYTTATTQVRIAPPVSTRNGVGPLPRRRSRTRPPPRSRQSSTSSCPACTRSTRFRSATPSCTTAAPATSRGFSRIPPPSNPASR